MTFTVTARSHQARLAAMELPHGVVATPAFMPVGTNGAVKAVLPDELSALGYNLMLSNTYHLSLRPGLEVIREAGGLHGLMGWDGNILTDSGGYQVFSLARLRSLREEGVEFQSHIDGARLQFTPESVVDAQVTFGSDIQMPLDVCVSPEADREECERAVELTSQWLQRARLRRLAHSAYNGSLFGIVQGQFHEDLRSRSAAQTVALELPGYAIGGLSVGEDFPTFRRILRHTAPLLPENRPRYVMGIGTPELMLEAVASGIDLFDCVFATRVARNATLFTTDGRINLRNQRFTHDHGPLDPALPPEYRQPVSRAYLRHLFVAGEINAMRYASLHNLGFLQHLMDRIRETIAADRFAGFHAEFLRRYTADQRNAGERAESTAAGADGHG